MHACMEFGWGGGGGELWENLEPCIVQVLPSIHREIITDILC